MVSCLLVQGHPELHADITALSASCELPAAALEVAAGMYFTVLQHMGTMLRLWLPGCMREV